MCLCQIVIRPFKRITSDCNVIPGSQCFVVYQFRLILHFLSLRQVEIFPLVLIDWSWTARCQKYENGCEDLFFHRCSHSCRTLEAMRRRSKRPKLIRRPLRRRMCRLVLHLVFRFHGTAFHSIPSVPVIPAELTTIFGLPFQCDSRAIMSPDKSVMTMMVSYPSSLC